MSINVEATGFQQPCLDGSGPGCRACPARNFDSASDFVYSRADYGLEALNSIRANCEQDLARTAVRAASKPTFK